MNTGSVHLQFPETGTHSSISYKAWEIQYILTLKKSAVQKDQSHSESGWVIEWSDNHLIKTTV